MLTNKLGKWANSLVFIKLDGIFNFIVGLWGNTAIYTL